MTAPNLTDRFPLTLAEVVRMQAEINDATSALAEMTADRDAMIPIVSAATKLVLGWRVASAVPVSVMGVGRLVDAVDAYQAGPIPVATGRNPGVVGEETSTTPDGPQEGAQPGFVAADCITAERRVIEAAKAWRSMGTHYRPSEPVALELDYAVDLLRSLEPGGYSVYLGPDPFAAPPKATQPDAELLTADEHRAMELTGELAGLLSVKVVADGRSRDGDRRELMYQLHAIQNAIAAQAAARAYPDRYRLLGADDPGKAGAAS